MARSGSRPKTGLTLTIRVEGLPQVLRAFKELPKVASDKLRDKAQDIARRLAGQVQSAGRAEGQQAAIVAATVKAKRDRVPVITVGGMARIGRNRVPAYKLLFGSEFGSNRLHQFKPHVGRGSYWVFSTVDDKQDEIFREWKAVADEIAHDFGTGA